MGRWVASEETLDILLDTALANGALSVSKGDLTGVSKLNKFGRNTDIDTAAAEDIWDGGGLWVPPTAARIHNLVSTVANDAGTLLSSGTATTASSGGTTLIDSNATFVSDGVAVGDTVLMDDYTDHALVKSVDSETQLTFDNLHHGSPIEVGDNYRVVTAASTGTSVVHVYGLDENMVEKEEFIIMNGASNVPTLNTYKRIYRMHTDHNGSNDTNVGTITATAQTDATVTAQINPGNGATLMAIYTVPDGKTAYLVNYYASINRAGNVAASADVSLRITKQADEGGMGKILDDVVSLNKNGNSYVQRMFPVYKKYYEHTDIIIRTEGVSHDDTDISAGFDLILINN